jgi:hypothetical protein
MRPLKAWCTHLADQRVLAASWPRDGFNYPAFRFIHNISYQGRVPKLIRHICYLCLYRAHQIGLPGAIVRKQGARHSPARCNR